MRILVVEDDRRIAEPVASALRGQHHVVDVASSGETALELSGEETHDIVVLDVMLPGVGGVEVCRELRCRGSRAMVLMVTARDAVADKVAALDEGADDYLVKPFNLEELLARIRALARRGSDSRRPVLVHGKLELDQMSGHVVYNGRPIALTRTEYTILEMMLRQPKRVFSSDVLYDRASRLDGPGSRTAVKTHVANLRKKLREAGGEDIIVTAYGFGYRLADA